MINNKLAGFKAALKPKRFYRANGQFIINKETITNIKSYSIGKFIVNTNPQTVKQL